MLKMETSFTGNRAIDRIGSQVESLDGTHRSDADEMRTDSPSSST